MEKVHVKAIFFFSLGQMDENERLRSSRWHVILGGTFQRRKVTLITMQLEQQSESCEVAHQ
jgi:hypothetical protein